MLSATTPFWTPRAKPMMMLDVMMPFRTPRAKPMRDAPTPQCQEGTVRLECFDSSYILFFRLGTPNLPTIITTVLGYYKGRGPITTVAIQMGSQGHGMSCIIKM